MFASLTMPCTLWTLFTRFASLHLDTSQLCTEKYLGKKIPESSQKQNLSLASMRRQPLT